MFYRVKIDLAFTNPGVYEGLVNHAQGIISQAITINPEQDNQERGFIITQECFHDETPTKPCVVIDEQYTD